MSYQEKRSVVTLIGLVLILGFYSLYVYNKYVSGNPEIINDLKFWGKSILILIPVSIVSQIIIHILNTIVHKIVTKEDPPKYTDERDKLIELKAVKVAHWFFILGFFFAMGSLVLEKPIYVMFIILIGFGFLGSVISELRKIYLYRKGV